MSVATAKKAPARKTTAKKAPIPAPSQDRIEKPSAELSAKLKKGRAHSFRLFTAQEAQDNGWKVEIGGPLNSVTTFTKGDQRIVVTYSAKDFVRKAEGAIEIKPQESDKFKRLTAFVSA